MKRRRRYARSNQVTKLIKIFVIIVGVFFVLALGMYFRNRILLNNEARQAQIEEERKYQEKIDFINKVAPIAQRVNNQYGIFPSLTIAQAALESDFGRSGLAKQYNNLFGVKGTNDSNSKLLETKEYVNDKWITIKDYFRIYSSYEESIKSHTLLFVNGTSWNPNQYIDVLNATSIEEAANALQKDGYATDPDYAKKLLELINQFNLTKFD